jgi:threonine/homoserine/homoserine lactone efflux protein
MSKHQRGVFTLHKIESKSLRRLVIALTFLPLFLDPARPKLGQFGVMIATFAVIEFAWYFTYALGGRGLSAWLRAPHRRRLFNRMTGGVFVVFGLAIAATRA